MSHTTCGEGPTFHREIPSKFTMLWEPSGEGLGRQEGEVETLSNLSKARVSENWGVWGGGANGASSHSGGLEPKTLKARWKACQAKER